jgi:hypothetical protein
MVRSLTGAVSWLGFVLWATTACNDRGKPDESQSTAQSTVARDARGNLVRLDDGGTSIVSELRSRHRFGHRPQQRIAAKSPGAIGSFGLGPDRAVLPASRARYLSRSSSAISPVFLRVTAADAELPLMADGSFHVVDKASAIHVEARLLGARAVEALLSEGLAIFPHASANGGTVVQRPTEDGVEDYIELVERPQDAQVSYALRMLDGVAGMRIVGNTLEFVDAAGAPGLRIATPSIVNAQGLRVDAALNVEGCAVDRDPRSPWGRVPVAPGAKECILRLTWDDSRVRTYPALLDAAWVTTGSLSTARSGATADTLPNGLVLIAGGIAGDQWSCLDSTELYNPTTRTFASTGSLATARCRHSAARRASGQIVVMGGVDSDGTLLASTEYYDSTSGTWATGAPLLTARADHRAVLLNTGDVLVAGGTSNRAEKLSIAGATWGAAGTLAASGTAPSLTVLADGRALLTGPIPPQIYSPTADVWYPTTTSFSGDRTGHTATRLSDGQVLVVGEENPSAELFNPKSTVWVRTGAASAKRRKHTATLLSDGRVLLVGGLESSDSSDSTAEVYDPTWGTFTAGPGLGTPRYDHIAVLLPNGRVLVAGGIDSNYETISSAEEFDPAALNTVITEYKLAASIEPEVLSDRKTELWASIARPSTLANGTRYPLLLFLHGNHGTCGQGTNPRYDYDCQYTDSGTCPQGYVPTPSHRGYDYITRALAARGYFVVSINANRGITCGRGSEGDWGLNLARGRLILRHLEQLSVWNRGVSATPASVGVSLANRLDLTQVGLFGHSRGGEGARAAYQQYRDEGSPWPSRIVDPVSFRAIFEIGPVDGQSSRVLNAEGTRWNVLLPMCDGDVSDLEGVRPFDRMISTYSPSNTGIVSTYTVWGANHNFYNTEWQTSDSFGCTNHRALFTADTREIGSAEQRQTAVRSVSEFFLANVGKATNPTLDELFNPEWFGVFDSPVERGYGGGQTAKMTQMLEDFTHAAGYGSFNVPNLHSQVSVTHGNISEHDPILRAGTIRWTSGGPSTFFQTNVSAIGSGFNLRDYQLLDFRIGRASDELNVLSSTDITVQLVNADDSLSSGVLTSEWGCVVGPVGGPGGMHQMLGTIRIPLTYFGAANLNAIRGVRFTFTHTPTGAVHLANVRATRSTLDEPIHGSNIAPSTGKCQPSVDVRNAVPPGVRVQTQAHHVIVSNRVVSLRTAASGTAIEIVLSSTAAFPVRDDLLVLDVGAQQVVLSQHPQGDLTRVQFIMDKGAFAAVNSGAHLSVHFRRGSGDSWDFGLLDKSALDR